MSAMASKLVTHMKTAVKVDPGTEDYAKVETLLTEDWNSFRHGSDSLQKYLN